MMDHEEALQTDVESFYAGVFKDEVKDNIDLDLTYLAVLLSGLDLGKRLWDKITLDVRKTFDSGAKLVYSDRAFTLSKQRAIDYLSKRGLLLQNAPDPVTKSVLNMIKSPDFNVDNLAFDIKSKWDQISLARAKRIALTETTSAFSVGKEEAMRELKIKRKQWVNSGGNVRPNHTDAATGVYADVGYLFANGLMRPGDGGPADVCNCHCILIVPDEGDE